MSTKKHARGMFDEAERVDILSHASNPESIPGVLSLSDNDFLTADCDMVKIISSNAKLSLYSLYLASPVDLNCRSSNNCNGSLCLRHGFLYF